MINKKNSNLYSVFILKTFKMAKNIYELIKNCIYVNILYRL